MEVVDIYEDKSLDKEELMYQFDHEEIMEVIKHTRSPRHDEIERIIRKASKNKEVNLYEIDSLLKVWNDEKLFNRVIEVANEIRKQVFGNKVKIYVPVYITNVCVNNCIYCGFRRENRTLKRRTLSLEEWEKEIEHILNIGHRNIEVVLGYNPKFKSDNLADYIKVVSEQLGRYGEGSVILMSEPMEVEDYKFLKAAGLNEVYSWQETYNRERYAEVHPQDTHKGNYDYRITIFDRVLQSGIKRYGMGILFGLYNWEYDVLALMRHALWLRRNYGIDPYAFGIPRFKKADGAIVHSPFYRVNNKMYRLAVAVYRIVFPSTHTYMNTRENINFIIELIKGGGTEVNAEASTIPGGYLINRHHDGEQFFHYSYSQERLIHTLRNNGFEQAFAEVGSQSNFQR